MAKRMGWIITVKYLDGIKVTGIRWGKKVGYLVSGPNGIGITKDTIDDALVAGVVRRVKQ